MKTKLLLLLTICLMSFGMNAQITSVALVGSAVGGWPGEPGNPGPIDINQLTQVDAENWIIENLTIAVGPCKFRVNNTWSGAGFEWAGAYPTAIGTSAGYIYIPIEGVYTVTLNTTTGVYNFESGALLPIVKLIGTAVTPVDGIILSPTSEDIYTVTNVTLLDGTGQFEIDGFIFGETDFPTGILTGASNNIPIIAGTYSSISVNVLTGEYSFVTAPTNPNITVSGSAIGGANSTVAMTTNDGVTYYCYNLSTTQGELLFNIETILTESYGNSNFPIGIATLNGSPIQIPSGTWNVTLNALTKAYEFSATTPISSVAIVGSAVNGWPGDPNNPGPIDINQLTQVDVENWIIENLTIAVGPCKFRANNAWSGAGFEWAGAYPTAIGTSAGDIYIPIEGVYTVTLNTTTGVYNFQTDAPLPNVQLIGSAVSSGNPIILEPSGTDIFTATDITLVDGNAQFSVDGIIFGENQFPTGTLTGATNNIPIIAGNYASITVNLATGQYSFVIAPPIIFSEISINGTAVGGSGDGFDYDMTTSDNINYNYPALTTVTGGVKFRTNHNWVEPYYGNTDFPSGIASVSGADIPVPAGIWDVTFNITSGAYSFTNTANATISIVGSGAGGWPGDTENPGPIDIHQLNTNDGINYIIYGVTLTDGEVKFRQDNNWTLNWSSTDFPNGIGSQDAPTIPVVAGTYTITFNRNTGEYSFGDPLRIAIVGTAIGGWPTGDIGEIDAHRLDSEDGVNFRLDTITLTDGLVKFRQNNSWDVNWGGNSLDGTLVLNGPEIPVSAGTYSIAMNRVTGDYSLASEGFELLYFKIYPNPTQNVWNFTSAKQTIETIQIVDVLGKTVMTIAPKDLSATVDASSLTRGLYFAKISTANATETAKLMKN